MKAEEEVDLVDKDNVHTGSKGTSNITSYPRNNFSKTDIEYLSPGIYSKQNFGLGILQFCWQENWSHLAILSFREKRESAII